MIVQTRRRINIAIVECILLSYHSHLYDILSIYKYLYWSDVITGRFTNHYVPLKFQPLTR